MHQNHLNRDMKGGHCCFQKEEFAQRPGLCCQYRLVKGRWGRYTDKVGHWKRGVEDLPCAWQSRGGDTALG